MDKFWRWMLVLLLIFAFVAVLTHAAGFATAAGSLFSGLTGLGATIETGGTKTLWGRVDEFWKWATYALLAFALVAAMVNASAFARGVGTLFGGLAGLGSAIETAGKQ